MTTFIRALKKWIVTRPIFNYEWLTDAEYRAMFRESRSRIRQDKARWGLESALELEEYRLEREYPGIRAMLARTRANAERYGMRAALKMIEEE